MESKDSVRKALLSLSFLAIVQHGLYPPKSSDLSLITPAFISCINPAMAGRSFFVTG